VYHDPITLEQAAVSSEKEYMKITMLNGDEYIYEELEVVDGNYYGIQKDEIKEVQKQNKKSSVLLNILGITIGAASVFLGVTMF
jgi:hypothetical protein